MSESRRTVEAIWRIEGPRIVATLARVTGDVGLAEDAAQDAVVEALRSWPTSGVPRAPGAWLTTVARRRATDRWRQRRRLDEHHRAVADRLEEVTEEAWQPIADDVLRLAFVTCHPLLTRPAQVALTLRLVAGLTTDEIARLLLVPVPTVQQRIVRAKRTLVDAHVTLDPPGPDAWAPRLGAVLAVVHLLFTEGYAATRGDRWIRPELAHEALRLGRTLARLVPDEPEVHGLVALMELQAARFAARTSGDGSPVLLADQDRSRWDRAGIERGRAALRRSDAVGGRGAYGLQAAIAACHATAPSVETTDWDRIVRLYELLGQVAPSPVVELNRAVAVSVATGPASALPIVERLSGDPALSRSHLLPSVRGELLAQLGRVEEAREELRTAAELATNDRERAVLRAKARAL